MYSNWKSLIKVLYYTTYPRKLLLLYLSTQLGKSLRNEGTFQGIHCRSPSNHRSRFWHWQNWGRWRWWHTQSMWQRWSAASPQHQNFWTKRILSCPALKIYYFEVSRAPLVKLRTCRYGRLVIVSTRIVSWKTIWHDHRWAAILRNVSIKALPIHNFWEKNWIKRYNFWWPKFFHPWGHRKNQKKSVPAPMKG